MRHGLILLIVAATIGVLVEAADPEARTARKSTGRLDVTVESRLVKSNLPADPLIDFAVEARRQGLEGVLDPDSIRVVNRVTGQEGAHSLGPGFRHGDSGRVRWLITGPVSYTHLRAHETSLQDVCRLLREK